MKLLQNKKHSAFTLVEVAIALAVIAFALTAILRVLPKGMTTQRDNRHDTIINHDATYLLEAIRSGAQGMDDLTNFVDAIAVDGVTNFFGGGYTSGEEIVSLLTTPGADVRATVRAISGSAATRGPSMRDFTMRYQLQPQILQAASVDPADTLTYPARVAHNLYEVRLVFRWPVLPGATPAGRLASAPFSQSFRTVVSGSISTNGLFNSQLFTAQ